MFERFTEDARQVVVLAQDEAMALGHGQIGDEHLLLGVLRVERGLAFAALTDLGVTEDDVRMQVSRIVGGGGTAPTGQIPFTVQAKRVLERALRAALELQSSHIGPEHVLLGIVEARQSVAVGILTDLDAGAERVRGAVYSALERESERSERPEPFARFTERARQVLAFAKDEARDLKHNYVGTEHLLLGLLREGHGIAARVLDDLGIEIGDVRLAVADIGQGDEVIVGEIPLTPRSRRVLELALQEAASVGHDHVGTEHLLLGLAREREGVAMRILLDHGVDADMIRVLALRALGDPGWKDNGDDGESGPGEHAPSGFDAREALRRITAAKVAAIELQHFELAALLRDFERRLERGDTAPPRLGREPERLPVGWPLVAGGGLIGLGLGLGFLIWG